MIPRRLRWFYKDNMGGLGNTKRLYKENNLLFKHSLYKNGESEHISHRKYQWRQVTINASRKDQKKSFANARILNIAQAAWAPILTTGGHMMVPPVFIGAFRNQA